jgi:type III pantothenate kinase
MSDTVLAIDIGNTNIKVALFKERLLRKKTVPTNPIKKTYHYRDVLREFLGDENPVGGVLASVVPPFNSIFLPIVESMTGNPPLLVSHTVKTGLCFDSKALKDMGADRMANAVAAYDMVRDNVAAVDCGTATTVTVVDSERNVRGGFIVPGMDMMCTSLKEHTGKLPHVRLSPPSGVMGKETRNGIISGILYGTAGAVERIYDEITSELGSCVMVLTGGSAALIKDLLRKECIPAPELTLTGLKLIFERNRT